MRSGRRSLSPTCYTGAVRRTYGVHRWLALITDIHAQLDTSFGDSECLFNREVRSKLFFACAKLRSTCAEDAAASTVRCTNVSYCKQVDEIGGFYILLVNYNDDIKIHLLFSTINIFT